MDADQEARRERLAPVGDDDASLLRVLAEDRLRRVEREPGQVLPVQAQPLDERLGRGLGADERDRPVEVA